MHVRGVSSRQACSEARRRPRPRARPGPALTAGAVTCMMSE